MFEKKDTVSLFVENMMCNHCVAHINDALKNIDGVKKINIDLPSKTVKVDYISKKINAANIKSIIEAEGYKAEIK